MWVQEDSGFLRGEAWDGQGYYTNYIPEGFSDSGLLASGYGGFHSSGSRDYFFEFGVWVVGFRAEGSCRSQLGQGSNQALELASPVGSQHRISTIQPRTLGISQR